MLEIVFIVGLAIVLLSNYWQPSFGSGNSIRYYPTEQELREQKRQKEIETEALKLSRSETEKTLQSIDDVAFLPSDVRTTLEKSIQADNLRRITAELQRGKQ